MPGALVILTIACATIVIVPAKEGDDVSDRHGVWLGRSSGEILSSPTLFPEDNLRSEGSLDGLQQLGAPTELLSPTAFIESTPLPEVLQIIPIEEEIERVDPTGTIQPSQESIYESPERTETAIESTRGDQTSEQINREVTGQGEGERPLSKETSGSEGRFTEGFLQYGGNLSLLRHLLEDVRPCEGEFGVVYTNGYVSAFQFNPGTWRTVEARSGRSLDPTDPFDTGVAVATLLQIIDNPGSTAGWPYCWWRGQIP